LGAGALRTLNAVRTGFGVPENDPPVGEEVVNLSNITAPLPNMVADFDDVVHPNASKPLPALVGSEDNCNLHFPTGHIGAAVSSAALKKLWPEIGQWLIDRD
jgi:polyhydroxyalkanoate synthase